MNYLAHFYLARGSDDLILGNFIADFVKGKQFEKYPDAIVKGILMHRDIDTFTDSHPIVYKTKERLFNTYHKYASVVVDIYYDHILAQTWVEHHHQPLGEFASDIYNVLYSNKYHLPERAVHTLSYMSSGDWLTNYAKIEGIDRTLLGLSRRTKFDSGIETASRELLRDLELIKSEFKIFFPELDAFVKDYQVH